MATSIGGAVARGIESGFDMGLRADEAALRKRADERATDELNARLARDKRTERRQGLVDNLDLIDRQQKTIVGRRGELEALSTAAQTAGQPVDPAVAKEHGELGETLTGLRQKALDYFSRAQTGQLDPLDSPPAELYTNMVAATGRPVKELREVPKYIANVQAGLETGNNGLVVQGMNGLMAPELRRGVGTESPHGGTIVRKEIIGMDPAIDGRGNPLPGKFMPRLRVYVEHPNAGSTVYYDAPMTKDGSGDGDDHVVTIDVKNGMNWMGNLGTLATAIQRPDVSAKLDQGEQEVGGKLKKYLDDLTVISRPKMKGASGEKLELIEAYARKNNVSPEEAAKKLQGMGVIQTLGALGQKLAAIDDLDVPEEQKVKLKRDAALGAGGKTTGLIPTNTRAGKGGASASTGTSKALGGAVAPAGTGNQTVDFWARAVIAGDREWQIGLGRSKSGSELIEAVKRRVPQMASEMGLTPQDMGTTRAQQAALGATLKELTKRNTAVDMFADKLEKDMQTYDGILDKAGNDSPMLIQKPLNALRRQFSDPALAQLDLAAKQVALEYERLITGGTLSVAQLHAGAAEDAKKLLNGEMTPKQARAIMETMRAEMKNARETSHGTLERITGQIRDLGGARAPGAPTNSTPGPSTAPVAGGGKYQEGQTATGPGGKKMVFKGGAWQPL